MDHTLNAENASTVQKHAEQLLSAGQELSTGRTAESVQGVSIGQPANPLTFRQYVVLLGPEIFESSSGNRCDLLRGVFLHLVDMAHSSDWREPASLEEMIGRLAISTVDSDCRGLTGKETSFLYDLWDQYESILLMTAELEVL